MCKNDTDFSWKKMLVLVHFLVWKTDKDFCLILCQKVSLKNSEIPKFGLPNSPLLKSLIL